MSNENKKEIESMPQEEREEYFAKCGCSKYIPCPEWHVCPLMELCPYNFH